MLTAPVKDDAGLLCVPLPAARVRPSFRWVYAVPQPNFKPWSMRLSTLGALLSIPAVAVLILRSAESFWHVAGFSLYGLGLFGMFAASAAYHGCKGPESRVQALRKLDYAAIALLGAGYLAPFCFTVLRSTIGLGVLGAVWALAALAIYLILTRRELPVWGLIGLYLTMGWMGIILIHPIILTIGPGALTLVALGGVVYSVGTFVFNGDETRYVPRDFGEHEIWHALILVAAGLHYSVFYLYLLP